jgi:hypothetical protein
MPAPLFFRCQWESEDLAEDAAVRSAFEAAEGYDAITGLDEAEAQWSVRDEEADDMIVPSAFEPLEGEDGMEEASLLGEMPAFEPEGEDFPSEWAAAGRATDDEVMMMEAEERAAQGLVQGLAGGDEADLGAVMAADLAYDLDSEAYDLPDGVTSYQEYQQQEGAWVSDWALSYLIITAEGAVRIVCPWDHDVR